MTVTGRGAEVKRNAPAARRPPRPLEFPPEFDMGDDPYKAGLGGAWSEQHGSENGDAGADYAAGEDIENMDEEFSGLPMDVVELIEEAIAEEVEIPENSINDPGDNQATPGPVGDCELADAVEGLGGQVSEGAEAGGAASSSSESQGPRRCEPADAIAHASMSAAGYISCTKPPWDTGRSIGRITAWPSDAPVESQNVVVRCYMHSKCSYTRKRRAFTNEALMTWLFEASPLAEGASTAERQTARDNHRLKAATILATRPPKAD